MSSRADMAAAYTRAWRYVTRRFADEVMRSEWLDAVHTAWMQVMLEPREVRNLSAYIIAMAKREMAEMRRQVDVSQLPDLRCCRILPDAQAIARTDIRSRWDRLDQATQNMMVRLHILEEDCSAQDRMVFARRIRVTLPTARQAHG